jgi:hypothetical protein
MDLWFARRPGPDGSMELTAVLGDGHPYRSVVDAEPGPKDVVLYRSFYRPDGTMTRAVVDPAITPRAPGLWYLEWPESELDPPATNLIAFATPEFADGTIVDGERWEALGADVREQVAALRWWTRTGQVHQVYVAPQWRRCGIGNKIVLVGAASTIGRRWPSLWSGGETTDLGEAWVRPAVWGTRVAPRSRRIPPMTPPPDAVGVPQRHLQPDAPRPGA